MKESLNQGVPVTIGEIMEGANKHAATDKTKDQEEAGKGKGGSGQNQNQNQNHGGTWWLLPIPATSARTTTLRVIRDVGQLLKRYYKVRVPVI